MDRKGGFFLGELGSLGWLGSVEELKMSLGFV